LKYFQERKLRTEDDYCVGSRYELLVDQIILNENGSVRQEELQVEAGEIVIIGKLIENESRKLILGEIYCPVKPTNNGFIILGCQTTGKPDYVIERNVTPKTNNNFKKYHRHYIYCFFLLSII